MKKKASVAETAAGLLGTAGGIVGANAALQPVHRSIAKLPAGKRTAALVPLIAAELGAGAVLGHLSSKGVRALKTKKAAASSIPNYRPALDLKKSCRTCVHISKGRCTKFDAKVRLDHVSDAWKGANPKNLQPQGRTAQERFVASRNTKTKTAGTPFLDQDRPEKVKEIYRALKRDHPSMPAEMKARIASRKGKGSAEARKPPETGGPAHKAPVTAKYTQAARKRDKEKKASAGSLLYPPREIVG